MEIGTENDKFGNVNRENFTFYNSSVEILLSRE